MILSVAEFRQRVRSGMDGLVADLQDLTGRQTDEEAKAWRESLPKACAAFSAPELQPLHLYFGGNGRLSLEYRLPASASWCDMVLLGRHRAAPSAVIVELKNWQTRTDAPGRVESLMVRFGAAALHPSDQVRGYTEYCRRYHSTVLDTGASVHGCVLFTKDAFFQSYSAPPNDKLFGSHPCFTAVAPRSVADFGAFLRDRISEPDERFADSFEDGGYRQNRSFLIQVAAQMEQPDAQLFELLDNQRLGFAVAKDAALSALFDQDGSPKSPKKRVLVVEGPPGSGKSVIAARLWAALIQHPGLGEGDVVITTTSSAQNHNWEFLLKQAGGTVAASGVIKGANEYSPSTTHELGKLRKRHPQQFDNIDAWRENLKLLRALNGKLRLSDSAFLVSIVDEAHALINPEHSDARGQFGFPVHFGPQAYHIMRGSVVTVFLMDSKQNFRERENTTREQIEAWAGELGAEVTPRVTLEGAQFRCGGSVEYVDWLEAVLRGSPAADCRTLSARWRRDEAAAADGAQATGTTSGSAGGWTGRAKVGFVICDSPAELERGLRQRVREGATARLVASYAREWKTEKVTNPHALPGSEMDFHIPYSEKGAAGHWSRIWNFKHPVFGYTAFVQAPPGSPMGDDPLCEVGCPYVVRGFDYDYIGLLWLGDVRWSRDRWAADRKQVFETGLSRHMGRARDERGAGPHHDLLRDKLLQGYRILMTRAIKGMYLWFENDETRHRFEECLGH
jgi:uncharacterized protein